MEQLQRKQSLSMDEMMRIVHLQPFQRLHFASKQYKFSLRKQPLGATQTKYTGMPVVSLGDRHDLSQGVQKGKSDSFVYITGTYSYRNIYVKDRSRGLIKPEALTPV